jgi:hypothetical protein
MGNQSDNFSEVFGKEEGTGDEEKEESEHP